MEVNVEYLNKWSSLTGERARLEANLFLLLYSIHGCNGAGCKRIFGWPYRNNRRSRQRKMNSNKNQAVMYIFAGNNGSGKSLTLSQLEIITLTTLITQVAFDQHKVLQAALNVGFSK